MLGRGGWNLTWCLHCWTSPRAYKTIKIKFWVKKEEADAGSPPLYAESVSKTLMLGNLTVMCILTPCNSGLRCTLSRLTEKHLYESPHPLCIPYSVNASPLGLCNAYLSNLMWVFKRLLLSCSYAMKSKMGRWGHPFPCFFQDKVRILLQNDDSSDSAVQGHYHIKNLTVVYKWLALQSGWHWFPL